MNVDELNAIIDELPEPEKDNISCGDFTFGMAHDFLLLWSKLFLCHLAKVDEDNEFLVHKSKCDDFGRVIDDGLFVVSCLLPEGVVAVYYELAEWDSLNLPECPKCINDLSKTSIPDLYVTLSNHFNNIAQYKKEI